MCAPNSLSNASDMDDPFVVQHIWDKFTHLFGSGHAFMRKFMLYDDNLSVICYRVFRRP